MALISSDLLKKGFKLNGIFTEKDFGKQFEYGLIPDFSGFEFGLKYGATHLIYVGGEPKFGFPYRYAKIKKTVVYVMTDEDDYGFPIWEKWNIKKHIFYSK